MKIHLPLWCRLIVVLSTCLAMLPGRADSAPALDIPSLSWTPRSDWANVKDAPYGAKGDGVADDTGAIEAALLAVGDHKSKLSTVYLPAGTYKITAPLSWWPPDNVQKAPQESPLSAAGGTR